MFPLPPSSFFAYLPFASYESGDLCQLQATLATIHLAYVLPLALDFGQKHSILTFDLCPLQAQVQLEQL